MNDTIADAIPALKSIAYSLAEQWPGIDRQDIQQHMSERVTARWRELRDLDPRVFARFAKREGIQYCTRERDYWQRQTAEWIYTPREVRALLAEYFDSDAWLEAPKRPDSYGQTVASDGLSVALMDIRTAFENVSEQHTAAIFLSFADGHKPVTSTEKMRLTRAVDAVTERLNRRMSKREGDRAYHDGPGSRTVMSNAASRAATSNNY